MNLHLSDPTTLKEVFDQIESWGNLPTSSLSQQQVALINLRNSVLTNGEALKNGGGSISSSASACFICIFWWSVKFKNF